jgi:hypothetical protein
LLAQLACLGTRTITGIITACGRQDQDWTAEYRMYSKSRVNPKTVLDAVRESIRQEKDDVVVALDDTLLRKSGKKTHGVQYMRDPLGPPFQTNLIRAQRFLQISMLARHKNGCARMIPIDWKHAPCAPKPPKNASAAELRQNQQERQEHRLALVAAQRIEALKKSLDEQEKPCGTLHVLVDGGYTNRTFFSHISQDIVVVGRIRRDAQFYHLPETQKEKGRNKAYGELAPTPETLLKDPEAPWDTTRILIGGTEREIQYKRLTQLRWKPTGQHKIVQMLVLKPVSYRLSKNGPVNRRQPAYLICTDPGCDPQTIIQHYVYRWDIEVNFRDEKTLLGVGEAQTRGAASVQNTTALAVAAYSLLLCACIQCDRNNQNGTPISRPKWQRQESKRPTTMNLIKAVRMEIASSSAHFSGLASQNPRTTKPPKCMPHLIPAVKHASTYT